MTDLNSDSLIQVFSNLLQTGLFEVMSVCKAWERAVMEDTLLWRKVKVMRRWDTESTIGLEGHTASNQLFWRVLNATEDVTFSGGIGIVKEHIMSVAKLERPYLRTLSLLQMSVTTSTLSLLLSKSRQLGSLKIDGELLGSDHIHVSHPTLETLDIEWQKCLPLTLHCRDLTHLTIH